MFSRIDGGRQRTFILLNKVDKVSYEYANKNVSDVNNFVLSNDYKADIVLLSAKENIGIQELKDILYRAEQDLIPNEDSTFITNTRHLEALQNASSALSDCYTSLSLGTPSDLVAEDLRRALSAINSILGKDLLDPEVILHNIFRNHCIGK